MAYNNRAYEVRPVRAERKGNMVINIAIDGPVGAGKSSIADEVAKRLGILHLDTGAMYRTLALHVLRSGVDPADEAAVSACCERARVNVRYENGAQRTLLEGEDVTGLIRTGEVSTAASLVSRRSWPRRRICSSTGGTSARACCRMRR